MIPAYIEKRCAALDAEISELEIEVHESAADPDVCDLEFSAMYLTLIELETYRLAMAAEHEL